MASGVEVRGLKEFASNLDRMPGVLRARLRGVAQRTAHGIASAAIANARKYGWKTVPNEIRTLDVADKQLFRVVVEPRPPRPHNLPLWLEYGTVKMTARPFIGPPTRAANSAYASQVDAALQAGLNETVGH